VSQSPRFSAPLIGFRSLGFVRALWAWRTLVPVPRLAPLFIVALRERESTAIHGRRPRSGHGSDRERSVSRSGDHFPNICYHICQRGDGERLDGNQQRVY
jgi:hypothetical protein